MTLGRGRQEDASGGLAGGGRTRSVCGFAKKVGALELEGCECKSGSSKPKG